ncbi:hypothetical protein AOLI_G00179470 [Acnodon oligacanthus]
MVNFNMMNLSVRRRATADKSKLQTNDRDGSSSRRQATSIEMFSIPGHIRLHVHISPLLRLTPTCSCPPSPPQLIAPRTSQPSG